MSLRLKNKKEFERYERNLKNPQKGNTKIVKKKPISKSELIKMLDDGWRDKILTEYDHKCEIPFCSNEASVAHHFIRKSQSFKLRFDKRNLIPLCHKHHDLLHNRGKETEIAGIIIKKRGQKWFDELLEIKNAPTESSIRTKKYLENKLKELYES